MNWETVSGQGHLGHYGLHFLAILDCLCFHSVVLGQKKTQSTNAADATSNQTRNDYLENTLNFSYENWN